MKKSKKKSSQSRLPGIHKLKITFFEGRDLIPMDITGFSDPFIKFKVDGVKLFQSDKCAQTLNPMWNETVVLENINVESVMVVQVFDKDAIGEENMGKFTIPAEDIIKSMDEYVDKWYNVVKKNKDAGVIRLMFEFDDPLGSLLSSKEDYGILPPTDVPPPSDVPPSSIPPPSDIPPPNGPPSDIPPPPDVPPSRPPSIPPPSGPPSDVPPPMIPDQRSTVTSAPRRLPTPPQ